MNLWQISSTGWRIALALFFLNGAGPTSFSANPPGWWATSGATNGNQADNLAAANVGQLKQMAFKAYGVLVQRNWAGNANTNTTTLDNLISGWVNEGPLPSDYSALTLGQLKYVGSLFWNVLISKKVAEGYPWGRNQPDDNAVANLGQLKHVFSFDISTPAFRLRAGANFSLALKTDGTVLSWGVNNLGQLGNGTYLTNWYPWPIPNLPHVVDVSAGLDHCLAALEDGSVMAWGSNESGNSILDYDLGVILPNNATFTSTPVSVPGFGPSPNVQITKVAAGGRHSLALDSSGHVWAWGDNSFGQLGYSTGSATYSVTPHQVQFPNLPHPNNTIVRAIAAGDSHSVAILYDYYPNEITTDGDAVTRIWTWGNNGDGQLGDNGMESSSVTPVQVLAASATGAMQGDGTFSTVSGPVGPNPWVISAGNNHTLALDADGNVWAWGDGSHGQLGGIQQAGGGVAGVTRGVSRVAQLVPSLENLGQLGIADVSAGLFTSYAIQGGSQGGSGTGTLFAWGDDTGGTLFVGTGYNGALGTGTGATDNLGKYILTPTQVPGVPVVSQIATSGDHSVFVTDLGDIYSVGDNQYGELGNATAINLSNPTTPDPLQTTFAPVVGLSYAFKVATPTFTPKGSASLKPVNVAIWCSTPNTTIYYTTDGSDPSPTNVSANLFTPGSTVNVNSTEMLRAKAFSTATINGFSVEPSDTYSAAYRIGPKVSAGLDFTLVLKSDGSVWGWGSNDVGQMGNGDLSVTSFLAPAPISLNGATAIDISAGGSQFSGSSPSTSHALVVTSSGGVMAWGNNTSGQIGVGSQSHSVPTPAIVVSNDAGFQNIVAVAAGWNHSLALKSDGTVWAWGDNTNGELGYTPQSIPVQTKAIQVPGLSGVIAIAAGFQYSLALKADGTVWAWGNWSSGQQGNGATIDGGLQYSTVPVRSGEVYNAVAIATDTSVARDSHSLFLRGDGSVWAAGRAVSGALGNSPESDSPAPVMSGNLSNAITIAAGGQYSLTILLNSGQLETWGANDDGQLGNGTTTTSNPSLPAPVSLGTNILAAAAAGGQTHTVVLTTTGAVYSFGDNTNGALGLGSGATQSSSNTPQLIQNDSNNHPFKVYSP